MIKTYIVEREEFQISGELYLPDDSRGRYPIVIMSHGFGGDREGTRPYAEILVKEGIGCYIFDFCGGGLSSKSDGKMTDMSVLTESADIEAVIRDIRKAPFADRKNIFLMGVSQGGVASTIAAVEAGEDVKAMVLLYPAYVLFDDAKEKYPSEDLIEDTSTVFGLPVGRRYYEDALSLNIDDYMVKFSGNVLILHGNVDQVVPISYSINARKKFPAAKIIQITDAGHGFYGKEVVKAGKEMVSFIEENLKFST
ncbi:alpha/beta hydrolase family protein [Butyrivibrio sp. WCD3002]|uniref:alpha/beta hydrolase family protein n=1 Tax=Butyrivibrio sp. WCD3002 TaxID=1280676 RepID=UPI00040C2923|nr:alpha/beta fold hydrolase [Butyrivibrio sp. WCD3002]